MKRTLLFIFIFLFSLLLCSLACSQSKTVTILHTNDIHASFIPHEAFWLKIDPKPPVGGFEELAWKVDSLRKVHPATLLLDGGDVMTGTPISEEMYDGTEGGGLFTMMSKIGYDAWTIGNHDLDISQENLKRLTEIAQFPTLSANLTDSAGKYPFNNKEYIILERGGLKIGIFGLMSEELFRLTNTNNLKGLKVLSAVQTARHVIDKIDATTDLIIAVTHQGVDEDSILASQVQGLDVIVGGHSHTRLRSPKFVNGTVIVQAGSNCENIGELTITVANDSVIAFNGQLIQLWPLKREGKSAVTDLVNDFKAKIDAEYNEVLGTLQRDWKRTRDAESNIGQFIASAMREGAKADVAATNSSGIRKDLSAGPIKRLDLFEIAPFRNYLCTFTVTGKELRDFAEEFVKDLASKRNSLQVSGLECTWKQSAGNTQLTSVKVGGRELDENATYTFATTDYLINQAEKYLGLSPKDVVYSRTPLSEVLMKKVKEDKVISGDVMPQFREVQ